MSSMSQGPPPNWPPQQPQPQQPQPPQPPAQNPFGDQPPYHPYAPGGPYAPGSPFGPQRPSDLADDPAMRWVLPVGQSIWAILSGYLGLISLLMCFLGPFAVLTGIISIVEMRRNPRLSGWGRAIVGIVLGTVGSLGLVVLVIALLSDR
jgi:hypothetical protein